MSLKHDQCDRQRIKDFVGSRMTPSQQATFEEHLGHCEECRDTLWEQTADPDSWEKAGTYLRDDDAELEPLSSLSGTSGDRAGRNFDVDRLLKSLAPTDDPQMLGRLDGYEISGVIGCGGMGAVLKGFDRPLSRVVAIKVMAPHLATSGAARKRFAREAQAAAAMTHENVIDIYGVAESNGLPYLVMPYARGQSLQKRIDERGPLPVVEVLRIGSQIAAGLAAAHQQGLVHRDIKPANILLSDGIERLVITDFGLARAVDDASVTRTGVIAGTPQYMSPEQARGDAIDHRSDLFSLGSVL
jgi:serine/threonine protein kinase